MSRGAAFWESASTLVVRLSTVHPAHWFAGGRISDPVRTVSPPPPPPPPSPHANSPAHAKAIHQRFPLGAVQLMLFLRQCARRRSERLRNLDGHVGREIGGQAGSVERNDGVESDDEVTVDVRLDPGDDLELADLVVSEDLDPADVVDEQREPRRQRSLSAHG